MNTTSYCNYSFSEHTRRLREHIIIVVDKNVSFAREYYNIIILVILYIPIMT